MFSFVFTKLAVLLAPLAAIDIATGGNEGEVIRLANTILNVVTIYYLLKMEKRARARVKMDKENRHTLEKLEEIAEKADN